MKAARIHKFGSSDQLKLEDMPQPSPGPGEVLVAIRSAGVNPVDWKIREGYGSRTLPLTAGQDFAGEIVSATGTTGGFAPGARVFGFAQGSYAEFAVAKVTDLAHLPPDVAFETAAALPTPGLTAMQILRDAGVGPGQRVLIQGAAGSVGAIAVQLAHRSGARVLATALGRDTDYLRQMGADEVIDNRTQRFEDVAGEVGVVIDLVGGEVQKRSLEVVKKGGILASTVGIQDAADAERRQVRTLAFVMKSNAEDLAQLARLVQQGALRIRIAEVLPFPEARRAQDLAQSGAAAGKVLLRVA